MDNGAQDTARRMAVAHAIDAARDAIHEGRAVGLPEAVVFLSAFNRALNFVDEEQARNIVTRLLAVSDGEGEE